MEHFKHFIELQSLLSKISLHEDNIKSEEARIIFLESSRDKRLQERDQLLGQRDLIIKVSNEHEKVLFEKERDLKRATDNLTQASSESQMKTLESEIERLSLLTDQIQEEILSKLEEQENIENKINEAEEFLTGSSETLEEIRSEVENFSNNERKEISNYRERIELLLESLSASHRDFFEQTLKVIKDDKVISFLNGKICTRCRYEASSTQITEIENGRSNEVCNNCSRILIPSTINSF